MKFLFMIMVLATTTFASDLAKRPKPFAVAGGMAVFADFTAAQYEITYNSLEKKASASVRLSVETAEDGFIVFDSHSEPTEVKLDGETASSALTTTPNKESKLRIVTKIAKAGTHVITMNVAITQLVEFTSAGVKSAYWMTDLTDRGYLERYLPTNFLFDRIPMSFLVKFIGAEIKQNIYANGVIEKLGDAEYRITFPDGLNASCVYFHTTPANGTDELRFVTKSIDGREIPTVIYVLRDGTNNTSRLEDLKRRVTKIFNELESDYGAFPHPAITVYLAGSGGMEYSGATMTSSSALEHEFYHSYYARAVIPSDGNSGWIDEALASWRDNGYQTQNSLSGSTRMAALGEYNRVTDRQAYGFGAKFMAYLDGKTKSKGGLKPFLKDTVEKKAFDPLNVAEFIALMESYYGMSFTEDFRKYVFGGGSGKIKLANPVHLHPIHKQMTLAELKNLL